MVEKRSEEIVDLSDYSIQPGDVDSTQQFTSSFGKYETEESARWVVKLAQQRGSWKPFRMEEIEELYQTAGHANFHFHGLVEPWTDEALTPVKGGFILERDGRYFVTPTFIDRIFRSSPVQKTSTES